MERSAYFRDDKEVPISMLNVQLRIKNNIPPKFRDIEILWYR